MPPMPGCHFSVCVSAHIQYFLVQGFPMRRQRAVRRAVLNAVERAAVHFRIKL